jgi:hypothetical protein
MRSLIALALALAFTVFSGPVAAQQFNPNDWKEARPVTSIAVNRTVQAGVYRVSAVITDVHTAKVLGKPVLLTKPGVPGTIEMGTQAGVIVRFVVTVDQSGQTAVYRSEVLKGGTVQSGNSGTIAVQDEA